MTRIASTPRLIDLNVQGTKVTAEVQLLTKYPETHLAAQIEGRAHTLKDSKQRIYLNHDPASFRHLLTYLRDGRLPALSEIESQRLHNEAKLLGFGDVFTIEEARNLACAEPLPNREKVCGTERIQVSDACLQRYYAWSDALWRAGRYDESTIVFNNAATYEEGYERDAARAHYDEMLGEDPEDVLALCRIAVLECDHRDEATDECLELARKALVLAPGFSECRMVLADALLLHDEAIPVFTTTDVHHATEVFLAAVAAEDGANASGCVSTFTGALANRDLFEALAAVQSEPAPRLHDLAEWVRAISKKVDVGAAPEDSGVILALDGGMPVMECSARAKKPVGVRVIEECARQLDVMASMREALAILRDGVEREPNSTLLRCALAHNLLKCQIERDMLAARPFVVDEEGIGGEQTSTGDSDDEPFGVVALGHDGIEYLKEGIEALRHSMSLPAVSAAHPFDSWGGTAAFYMDLVLAAEGGSLPTQPEAARLLDDLRGDLSAFLSSSSDRIES